MTPPDAIARVRGILANPRLSPLPWTREDCTIRCPDAENPVVVGSPLTPLACDCELIVEAVNNLPALLDRLDAAEAKLAEQRKLLEKHRRYHSKGCPGLPECYVCEAENGITEARTTPDDHAPYPVTTPCERCGDAYRDHDGNDHLFEPPENSAWRCVAEEGKR